MSVSREEVLRIAQLAELDVEEEALPDLVAQMSRIIDYVAQLSAVPANGTVKVFVPGPDAIRFRTDEVTPITLEPRIGGEQLLGPDVRIVEVDAYAQIASFARHGAYGPTTELAVPHAFSFDVPRRVLRNVFRKSELRQEAPRRGAAWPRG